MHLFSLNGYQNDKICLELEEDIGFPDSTSYEGGYDIRCNLKIDAGCYHVEYDELYSATGAIFRFCDELKECYYRLEGQAEYKLFLEDNLYFKVEMTTGGHAVVTGNFQARYDKESILQFQIETDQSCFMSVIQDIEKLKEKYGN